MTTQSQHIIRSTQYQLALAVLVLFTATAAMSQIAVTASSPSYGKGLGRLITTEVERARIDEARFNVMPPKAYEGPDQLEIQGITTRPGMPKGQAITIWIDRRPYLERELPEGLKLVRDKNGEVTGITSRQPGGKLAFAKIGDFISRPQTKEEANALLQAELEAKASQTPPANSPAANTSLGKKLEDNLGAVVGGVKNLIDQAKAINQKQQP